MALFADEIAAFPLATTVFHASSTTVAEPLVHSILRFNPTEFRLASPLSARPSKCMSKLTLDACGSDDELHQVGAPTVPATESSTIAAFTARFGSRTSPETAPDADSASEGRGKLPETEALLVTGETHATCIHETIRFRPFAPTVCASMAPTERYFES